MARNLSTQDISWFLDLHEKEQLDLDPPYQRRSVWSPKDRRFFIDTVLNNYPAPPVFLHKTLDDAGRPTYHVVDGKQRLKTIIDFTQNSVRIPDDFADNNLQKKRWRDLSRETKEKFWNYVIIVEQLPDVSDALIKNTFERINRNSRKLMPQELRHAKYDGWFSNYAEVEAENPAWRSIGLVTSARFKRMAEVQFVSELMRLIINNKVEGFDQDGLDDIYASYEDLADQPLFVEEDFVARFEAAKNYIIAMIEDDPGIKEYLKVQANLYTLWGVLALEDVASEAVSEVTEKYRNFQAEVVRALREVTRATAESGESSADYNELQVAVTEYARSLRGASTDLPPREARHNALLQVMHWSRSHEDQ